MPILPNKPDWLAKNVSAGDDGEATNTEHPFLHALGELFEGWRVDFKTELMKNRTALAQQSVLMRPAYVPIPSSASISASGTATLDFGGPQVGRRWAIRSVTFSDATSFWNSMGAAQVTMNIGKASYNAFPPSSVRWAFPSTPNVATFSSDRIWVNPSDRVYLNITNGTSAQLIQGIIEIQDFPYPAGAGIPVEGI